MYIVILVSQASVKKNWTTHITIGIKMDIIIYYHEFWYLHQSFYPKNFHLSIRFFFLVDFVNCFTLKSYIQKFICYICYNLFWFMNIQNWFYRVIFFQKQWGRLQSNGQYSSDSGIPLLSQILLLVAVSQIRWYNRVPRKLEPQLCSEGLVWS